MNKYRIIIDWSEEDQVFIAEVPELPGCMTHGTTQTTALANANEAIQAWINMAKEFGDPIPKPKASRVASNRFPEAKYRPVIGKSKRSVRKNNPRNFSHTVAVQPTMNPKVR